MKTSLSIAACFAAGILMRRLDGLPDFLTEASLSRWTLYVLIFTVGVTVGLDRRAWGSLRSVGWRIVLVPLSAVVGTTIGVAVVLPILTIAPHEAFAVGFGLGYYSLSSILVGQIAGDQLALIALLSNIFRELITVTCAPLLVRLFGPFAPILAGGATTMDTTLPSIIFSSGRIYAPVAIFNSAVLTLLVPFLVMFALRYPNG